jgi:hypothetical protein
MRTIFLLTVAALLITACAQSSGYHSSDDVWTGSNNEVYVLLRDHADTISDAEIDHALETWRRYELPEPPANAPLVAVYARPQEGTRIFFNHQVQLGFLLESDTKTTLVMDGFHTLEAARSEVTFQTEEYSPQYPLYKERAYNGALAVGLHLWGRGERDHARRLIKESIPLYESFVPSGTKSLPEAALSELLGYTILRYWSDKVFEPDSDWQVIHKHLSKAVTEFRAFGTPWLCLYGNAEMFVESLEASLEPSTAEPGSLQFHIDSLVDVRLSKYTYGSHLEMLHPLQPSHEPLRTLLVAGFDSVPLLLDHLYDQRLTRSTWHAMFRGRSGYMTVGRFAHAILRLFSGGQQDRDDYEGWWAETRELDEASYFRELLTEAGIHPLQADESQHAAALVLGHKYPTLLAEEYRTFLRAPGQFPHESAHIGIALSNLPHATKVELLLEGAASDGDTRMRADALRTLRDLDEGAFAGAVAARLDLLDGALDRSSPRYSDAIVYTHLVQFTDNDAAWDALTRLAKRAEPALRVRILGRFGIEEDTSDPTQAMSFVAGFLDDPDVRRREDDVRQCDPVLRWGSISVRDVAAYKLAGMLELESVPNPDWTRRQWRNLHTQINETLEQQGIHP